MTFRITNTQVVYDIGREDRQRPAARGGADAGAYLSPPMDLLGMYDRVYREAGARVLLLGWSCADVSWWDVADAAAGVAETPELRELPSICNRYTTQADTCCRCPPADTCSTCASQCLIQHQQPLHQVTVTPRRRTHVVDARLQTHVIHARLTSLIQHQQPLHQVTVTPRRRRQRTASSSSTPIWWWWRRRGMRATRTRARRGRRRRWRARGPAIFMCMCIVYICEHICTYRWRSRGPAIFVCMYIVYTCTYMYI